MSAERLAGGGIEQHGTDSRRVCQQEDDHLCSGDGFYRSRGDVKTLLPQRQGLFRGTIIGRQVMTGGMQPFGHRLPQQPCA